MYSDDEVQEISPPVLTRSRHKKYGRRMLITPLDACFCHHSKRNKNNVETSTDQDAIDTTDVAAPTDAPSSVILNFIESSMRRNVASRQVLFSLFSLYLLIIIKHTYFCILIKLNQRCRLNYVKNYTCL
jgi:hypothetical protein